jgi:hypothetical protein
MSLTPYEFGWVYAGGAGSVSMSVNQKVGEARDECMRDLTAEPHTTYVTSPNGKVGDLRNLGTPQCVAISRHAQAKAEGISQGEFDRNRRHHITIVHDVGQHRQITQQQ